MDPRLVLKIQDLYEREIGTRLPPGKIRCMGEGDSYRAFVLGAHVLRISKQVQNHQEIVRKIRREAAVLRLIEQRAPLLPVPRMIMA